jgi:CheY-like chemotaxis protein
MTAQPSVRDSKVVLVVDDDLAVRVIIARLLEHAGYAVQLAQSGKAALLLLSAHSRTIGAILADVHMPELNGIDLATETRRSWPDIPVGLMSAKQPDELQSSHTELAGIPFLCKPFTEDELVSMIEALAGKPAALPQRRMTTGSMIGRHVGRLGGHPFVLRLGPSAARSGNASPIVRRYWEIEYEGQAYPWRPVHPEDEQDVAKLVRAAMTYLQRDLQRHG